MACALPLLSCSGIARSFDGDDVGRLAVRMGMMERRGAGRAYAIRASTAPVEDSPARGHEATNRPNLIVDDDREMPRAGGVLEGEDSSHQASDATRRGGESARCRARGDPRQESPRLERRRYLADHPHAGPGQPSSSHRVGDGRTHDEPSPRAYELLFKPFSLDDLLEARSGPRSRKGEQSPSDWIRPESASVTASRSQRLRWKRRPVRTRRP